MTRVCNGPSMASSVQALVVERHALSIATDAIGTMAAFWFIERLEGFGRPLRYPAVGIV